MLRAADGTVYGVRTDRGDIHAPAVVNAAGTWGGDLAALAGVRLPVLPRRGFVLVTEPLPRTVRHKVYAADYVADVASDSAALRTSPVVEGTAAGPVLIGATRERVGFDRSLSLPAVRALAAGAIGLFPFLERVRALRTYAGFRPYLPDHLPAIGPDPRAPGLFHACGHEGAGIGLATGTGRLVAQALTGRPRSWIPRRSGRNGSTPMEAMPGESHGTGPGPAGRFPHRHLRRPAPRGAAGPDGRGGAVGGGRDGLAQHPGRRPAPRGVLRDRGVLRLPGDRQRPAEPTGLSGAGTPRRCDPHAGGDGTGR
ncbi:hypothetical protein GCM10017687_77840 [Streptomyces echinatus]